jgi:hypothetical protein
MEKEEIIQRIKANIFLTCRKYVVSVVMEIQRTVQQNSKIFDTLGK